MKKVNDRALNIKLPEALYEELKKSGKREKHFPCSLGSLDMFRVPTKEVGFRSYSRPKELSETLTQIIEIW